MCKDACRLWIEGKDEEAEACIQETVNRYGNYYEGEISASKEDVVLAYHWQARIMLSRQKYEETLTAIIKAKDLYLALCMKDDKYARSLSECYRIEGVVRKALGEEESAIRCFRESFLIQDKLPFQYTGEWDCYVSMFLNHETLNYDENDMECY